MSKLPFHSTLAWPSPSLSPRRRPLPEWSLSATTIPENFTETKEVRAFAPMRADSAYLDTLKRYIEKKAATELEQGQTLDIVVTDIDRAGSYAPSVGSLQPVRVVKDVYPPRITLHFRLLDSQGHVIREGDRKLTDLGFMYDSPGGFSDTDPLRLRKAHDRSLAGAGTRKAVTRESQGPSFSRPLLFRCWPGAAEAGPPYKKNPPWWRAFFVLHQIVQALGTR